MKKALLFFIVISSSLIGFGQTVNIGDILCTDGSMDTSTDFPLGISLTLMATTCPPP